MEPVLNSPFSGPEASTLHTPIVGDTPAVPTSMATFVYEGFEFPFPRTEPDGRVSFQDLVERVLVPALASNNPRAFLKAAMVEVRDVKGKTFFPTV